MGFLKELYKEKKSLQLRLSQIDTLLSIYQNSESDADKLIDSQVDHNKPTSLRELPSKAPITIDNTGKFPLNLKKDRQLLWMFNNYFTQGVTLSTVQDKFNEFVGDDYEGNKKVGNVMRRLKKEGRFIFVQYNNQNKASFWGLPEWVDGKDFKSEFKPSENELPINIENIEISGNINAPEGAINFD